MAANWLARFTVWAEPGSPGLDRGAGMLFAAAVLTVVLSLCLFAGSLALGVFMARRWAARKGKKASVAGWLLGSLAGVGLVVGGAPYVFMLSLFLAAVATQAMSP